jgi:hypothetical protein
MQVLQLRPIALADLDEVPQILHRVAQQQMDIALQFVSCTREEGMQSPGVSCLDMECREKLSIAHIVAATLKVYLILIDFD